MFDFAVEEHKLNSLDTYNSQVNRDLKKRKIKQNMFNLCVFENKVKSTTVLVKTNRLNHC